MKNQYAVVNTMNQIGTDSIGTVISRHQTQEAAEQAQARHQRAVRRANGDQSYIPTRVVILTEDIRPGGHVRPRNVQTQEVI